MLLENRRFWSKTVNTVRVVREWNNFRICVVRTRWVSETDILLQEVNTPPPNFRQVKRSGTKDLQIAVISETISIGMAFPVPIAAWYSSEVTYYIHAHGQFKMETKVLKSNIHWHFHPPHSGSHSRFNFLSYRSTESPYHRYIVPMRWTFDVRVGSTRPLIYRNERLSAIPPGTS